MSFISDFKSTNFDLFKTDSNASNLSEAGQKFLTSDGREVALIQNGAVALTAGKLTQHSAIVANHQNLAVTAYSAGTPASNYNTTTAITNQSTVPATITLTLGATVLNSNQYQGGYAVVNAGTGIGQTLVIKSNVNAAASATGVVITLEDTPLVALDATSKINLIAQPYSGVVINPTTATASPAGVTLYAIPASVANTYDGTSGALTVVGTYQYGFIVTRGIVSCLSDTNTATVGLGVMSSTTTAGTIAVATATGNRVGVAYQTSVSAEARAIDLHL